ncbi:SDR family oxidoreductase [Propioniciclava sp. MC1595]|uniref:SDR family oxidoreductase n=1 Tax=Propioniciclava sp. MC1595 TaxID=2760308 RepID=UPI00166238F8|nr:SDR family oxidoreductase [Propioniciclava sp. MC1595]MBB1494220.1 SDR family oxidoreductase [Propioniciclava sp. MC1595]QTE25199.1 SDR family oxidoreductase [Propioniciclava sp. MC1595]
MRVLLTGGTGTISRAVVARVLAEGHSLSVLNRGNREPLPEGTEHLVGDVRDEASLRDALGGREFDAVVQFLAFDGEDVERDLRVLAGRVGQYVLVSSCSTYLKPLPHHVVTEDSPQGNPYSAYARDKIAGEEALRASAGDLPWTIVRPSHTYGERTIPTNFHFGNPWAAWQRVLDGKPVIVHGDGESLWTFTWNEDFAVGLVGLLGNEGALGRAVHITSDESITWNRAFRTVAGVIGAGEPDLVHVPSATLGALREDLEAALLGDKAATIVFDNTLVKSLVPAFDARTTWAEGVARAWEWMQAHPDSRRPDPAYDAFCDDVIARVRAWA